MTLRREDLCIYTPHSHSGWTYNCVGFLTLNANFNNLKDIMQKRKRIQIFRQSEYLCSFKSWKNICFDLYNIIKFEIMPSAYFGHDLVWAIFSVLEVHLPRLFIHKKRWNFRWFFLAHLVCMMKSNQHRTLPQLKRVEPDFKIECTLEIKSNRSILYCVGCDGNCFP